MAAQDGDSGSERATVSVQRLEILEAISAAALTNVGFEAVVGQLLARVTEAFRVDTVAVLLLDEERGELVARAAKGLEAEVEAESRIPLGRGFAGRVAVTRKPVAIDDVSTANIYNPILREAGVASLLGVPLIVDDRLTGVLHIGSIKRREFTGHDAELLQLVAGRIALAIEHTRLYEAERQARAEAEQANERIRRIESLTETALTHVALNDDLLAGLLERIREMLSVDTAAILLLDEERGDLVARAARGLEEEVERGVRIPLGEGFAGRIAAERVPVVLPDADHAEVVNPLLREKRIRSLAGVPLVAEDRVLGVLHVGTLAPRDFTTEDLVLLELASERIALGLAHSDLQEREHELAAALHRTLLPARLPDLPGLELAARYVPGDQEDIGGDWYDVIPLPRGELALVMGDVVSRGLRAASATSQIRNALRAYAIEGDRPARVLDRLDRIVHGLDGREMATLIYLVLDVDDLSYTFTTAGHPPPLTIGPDGSASYVEGGRSAPLGSVPDGTFAEASGRLEPGSTLLLYTDGLVERRDMWIDEGLRQLANAAASVSNVATTDALCARLLERLDAGAAGDDVAILALGATAMEAERLAFSLPAEPTSLALMRRALRRWLAQSGADEDELYDLLVASSEAAANAVEHAYGPVDASFEVEASNTSDDEALIVVRDFGGWRPPRGQNRGRGTLLMKELTDHFELVATETGTEVRLRRRLSGAVPA